MNDTPRPTATALDAYRALTSDLSMWSGTAHRLVKERIAAAVEAHGAAGQFRETDQEYVARVFVGGQHPFPEGECIHDDLNNNRGYEHVQIGYVHDPDQDQFVTGVDYVGWYPEWSADGEHYRNRMAHITVPAWVITDPDGQVRYRHQTDRLVEQIKADRTRRAAEIAAMVDRVRSEVLAERQEPGE